MTPGYCSQAAPPFMGIGGRRQIIEGACGTGTLLNRAAVKVTLRKARPATYGCGFPLLPPVPPLNTKVWRLQSITSVHYSAALRAVRMDGTKEVDRGSHSVHRTADTSGRRCREAVPSARA